MKPTLYTIIAYVPDQQGFIDRCGDFNTGEPSELTISYFIDKNLVSECYGQAKFQNYDTEITILINGMNPDEYHDFLNDEEKKDLACEVEEIENLGYKKYEELKEEKRLKDEAAQLKKQQEAEAKRRKEKEQLEQAERTQLAQLIAKYGQQ